MSPALRTGTISQAMPFSFSRAATSFACHNANRLLRVASRNASIKLQKFGVSSSNHQTPKHVVRGSIQLSESRTTAYFLYRECFRRSNQHPAREWCSFYKRAAQRCVEPKDQI